MILNTSKPAIRTWKTLLSVKIVIHQVNEVDILFIYVHLYLCVYINIHMFFSFSFLSVYMRYV